MTTNANPVRRLRRRSSSLAVALVIMGTILAVQGAPVDASPAPSRSYIVVLQSNSRNADVAQVVRRMGGDVTHTYGAALDGFSATMNDRAVAVLASNSSVAWIEPDAVGHIVGQILPTGVDRVDADLSPSSSIDGADAPVLNVDIAILDTGIDITHPDLRVAGSSNCVKGEVATFDTHGHGTFVAGNAAAIDNGSHVVGVAPGARVWAIQVARRNGVTQLSEVLCGIDWVTRTRTDANPANDIEVANMSLAFPGAQDDQNCGLTQKDAMHVAICESVAAGVTYTVAAGNESATASKLAPAAYDEVITVSALEDLDGQPGGAGTMSPECQAHVGPKFAPKIHDDTFAVFSNFGPDIDLIAPGMCIISTVPVRARADGTALGSGTSFSAPYVAGAAALYISAHPESTPALVQAALIAAGSFDWDNSDDPDGIKEPLLNVAGI